MTDALTDFTEVLMNYPVNVAENLMDFSLDAVQVVAVSSFDWLFQEQIQNYVATTAPGYMRFFVSACIEKVRDTVKSTPA